MKAGTDCFGGREAAFCKLIRVMVAASFWSESVSGVSAGFVPAKALDRRRLRRSSSEPGELVEDEELVELRGFAFELEMPAP
jgi:hypothetical protein